MENLTIETINLSEWEKHKELRLRAMKKDPHAFLTTHEEENLKTDEEWQARLKKYIQGDEAIMYFAKDGENLVGMMGAYWDNSGGVGKTATLFSVYIDEECRGLGLGKALLQKILARLKMRGDIEGVRLLVNADQLAAFHLYKNMEFKEVGRSQKTMADGLEHEKIEMRLKI